MFEADLTTTTRRALWDAGHSARQEFAQRSIEWAVTNGY